MDLEGDYAATEPAYRSKRERCASCMKLFPWTVILVAAGFATGLAFWAGGTVQARDATSALSDAFGVRSEASSWLYAAITSTVAALTIGGSVIVGAALLLSLVGTVERGLLLGACGRGSGSSAPEPWHFRGYQVCTSILGAAVAILMLACTAAAAASLFWRGAFTTAQSVVAAGDAAGVDLAAVSELAARAGALVQQQLVASDGPALAALLLGGGGLPFAPVCAPVCVNAGSFAGLLRMRGSCVCGAAVIAAVRDASAKGARGASVALAGGAAMWAATCLLLVNLVGSAVTAGFDRQEAQWVQEQRQERAAHGVEASPKDCVPAPAAAAAGFDDASGWRGATPAASGDGGAAAPNWEQQQAAGQPSSGRGNGGYWWAG